MYKIGQFCGLRLCNTPYESSDLYYLEPEAQGHGSSPILCHSLMKISILYEKLAYVLLPP